MKTTIKISLVAVMMAVMTLASCSSDEPADNKLTGKEMADHIYSVMNDYSEKTYVNETMDHMILLVSDKSEAHKICADMLDEKLDDKDQTFTLPDGYGNIRMLNDPEEGLFYNLAFNLKDSNPFTLWLCTKEYCEKENVVPMTNHLAKVWYCLNCKKAVQLEWREIDGVRTKVCKSCKLPCVILRDGTFF